MERLDGIQHCLGEETHDLQRKQLRHRHSGPAGGRHCRDVRCDQHNERTSIWVMCWPNVVLAMQTSHTFRKIDAQHHDKPEHHEAVGCSTTACKERGKCHVKAGSKPWPKSASESKPPSPQQAADSNARVDAVDRKPIAAAQNPKHNNQLKEP